MTSKQERGVYLYLTPPENYFWKWNEDSTSAFWMNGTKAASIDELLTVFVRMELQIIPPLGCLLLVLNACDDQWSGEQTRQLLERLLPTITKGDYQHKRSIHRLVDLLETLHDFTRGYRQSAAKFVSLIEFIFRKSLFNQNMLSSQGIMDGLRSEVWKEELPIFNDSIGRFNQELSLLEAALRSIDVDTLKEQLQTGVAGVKPADSIPDAEGELLSLASVLNDPDLFRLGKLVQQLVPLVEIPRKLEDSGDVSSGGVSDITTKGDLDKLLLSELAHDDLNLSIRLANNEALFIRREVPPVLPDCNRVIFLDNGIRFWGVSRLFATATALAFALKQDENRDCYHLCEGEFIPIELRNKNELLNQLGLLETGLQNGKALETVLSGLMSPDPEIVLITHKNVFDDQEFRRFFRKIAVTKIYICLVDQSGSFQMIEKNDKGMKVLSKALINLSDIIGSREADSLKKNRTGLPQIMAEEKFPLLQPGWSINSYYTSESKSTVGLTKDNRVLVNNGHTSFECHDIFQEIYNKLPNGHYKRCFIDSNEKVYVVVVDYNRTLHRFRFNNELEFIDEETMTLDNQFMALDVSPQVIHIGKKDGDTEYYSLETLTNLSLSPQPDPIKNPTSRPRVYHQKVWRFQKVFLHNDWFYLIKKNVVWTLHCHGRQLRMDYELNVSIDDRKMYQFGEDEMYEGTRIKLRSAKTENNSKFVLDGRGFLHLISVDPDVPEISILLVLGMDTAACTQDKKFAGAKNFIGNESESFDDVVDAIRNFCRNAT